ncbi:MAG: transposase InsO family protein [Candidatus Azotimanducaceae bacterium]|jgi:transposase InsO family protein
MTPRISAKGNCWDNAVAESFFATLEFELQEGKPMKDRVDARNRILPAQFTHRKFRDLGLGSFR